MKIDATCGCSGRRRRRRWTGSGATSSRSRRPAQLGPIVGRDAELDAVVDVLLRRTRRNPLLLGPAGSGKTAIVEGLAIRIARRRRPGATARASGCSTCRCSRSPAAWRTTRRSSASSSLEARHPSVVVFFDEIHLLAAPAVRDLGQALKPALARGEIACVGATTGEEFQANLESDAALVRRFSIIPVEPMNAAAVAEVMASRSRQPREGTRRHGQRRGAREIIALADQFLPNRSFPDKGVDLLEQAVAYAVGHGLTAVDATAARAAVSALTGMPADRTRRRSRSLQAASVDRARPGAGGRRRHSSRDSASRSAASTPPPSDPTRSRSSAGPPRMAARCWRRPSPPRSSAVQRAVIAIDLAGMTQDQSISTLLGSAPGLVGSDRPLPLQELRRSPWQVVLFRGIDGCAPSIRATIATALQSGSFTDAMGRRLPLGTSVVILTAPSLASGDGAPGTAAPGETCAGPRPGPRRRVRRRRRVGDRRCRRRDRRLAGAGPACAAGGRFARQGVSLSFSPEFVAWLRHGTCRQAASRRKPISTRR